SSVWRSAGVTSRRLGSLARRMRFSALRYSTVCASSLSVAAARNRRNRWTVARMQLLSEKPRFTGGDNIFAHRGGAEEGRGKAKARGTVRGGRDGTGWSTL